MYLAECMAIICAGLVLLRLGPATINRATLPPIVMIAYFALSTLWAEALTPQARMTPLVAGLGTAALFIWSWHQTAALSSAQLDRAQRVILTVCALAMALILLNWAIFHPEWLFVRRLRAGGVLNRANMGAIILTALAILAYARFRSSEVPF